MNPIVAVVGRPNVGKSTLFNRLVGQSLAIVDDMPGVTRDRHYAPAHLHGRNVTLVDTGGFDLTSDDPLQQGIARHVQAAIEEADAIICVLDGTASPTEPDREAINLLRRSDKPVAVEPEPAAPAVLVRIESKDPICGMMVDSVTAKFRSAFAERTVYFCCRHCKEMFDEDPERYRDALS